MFKCQECQRKDRDIEYLRSLVNNAEVSYLRKLVDSLLMYKGASPVEQPTEEVKPEEPIKGERYGD